MVVEQARLVAVDVGIVAATMALVYGLTPKPLPLDKGKPANVLEFVHTLWWYPFVFVLVGYAGYATLKLGATPASRWTKTCDESYAFLRLYVAAQLVAIPVEWSQPQALSKKLQMVGHHIVSIAGYCVGLWSHQCHFFGCAAGLSEVSTIFLEGLLLSKHVALQPLFDRLVPWFLPFNGGMLWLSFIIFRLALFPALIAICIYDGLYHGRETWGAVGAVKFCIAPMLAFLLALSASWFVKIHAGFMAKVMGSSASKSV